MIAYGCPKIMLKLNPFGTCAMFSFEDFYKLEESTKEVKILQSLEKRDFVFACVLAGCEYLENIERVGLKVALKFFDKHKTFEKVLGGMKEHPTYKDRVKPEYE